MKCAWLYGAEGKETELTGNEKLIWMIIKPTMDMNNAKYEELCQKRREVGALSHTNRYQLVPNATNCTEEEENKNKNKNENENMKEKEKEMENETVLPVNKVDSMLADFAGDDPDLLYTLRVYATMRENKRPGSFDEAECNRLLKALQGISPDMRNSCLQESIEKRWNSVYDHSDRKIPGKNTRSAPVNIPPQDPRKLKALVDLI